MAKKGILNEGLRNRQEQSVKETEAKIVQALKKQKHARKINLSQLERDSGVSRQHIAAKYSYLYDGRVNESKQVVKLKEELTEEKDKNKKLTQENTALRNEKNMLTDKLVHLYAIIEDMNRHK